MDDKSCGKEPVMRVNARLDEESQAQIDYIVAHTGQSVSHVVRESVRLYYAQIRAQRPALKHLSRLIGKGNSGRSDIASNVKAEISEILQAKHGLRKK
jgi:Arc/MetJ-type ribon-helix-helix transcriptional regulator